MVHSLERQVARTNARVESKRPARPQGVPAVHSLTRENVLVLQATAGNRAVSALVAQRCGPTPCDCPEQQELAQANPTVSRAIAVQRDEAPPKQKRDIAVVLSSSKPADAEAFAVEASSLTTAAPIPAPTPAELIRVLKNLPQDIGKLFIIGHSGDRVGNVVPEGKLIFAGGRSITLDALASGVGTASGGHPSSVEFRGCRIGGASAGLDALRKAVGAATASGSSCFVLAQVAQPVKLERFDANGRKIGEFPVTSKKQLKDPEVKDAFDREFDKQIREQFENASAGQVHLRSAADCIIGIGRGLTGNARSQVMKELYFRNGGKLEAKWVRQDGDHRFEELDPCFEDLTSTPKRGCSLVTVPSGGGGGGGGGKGACLPRPRDLVIAAALAFSEQAEAPIDPDLVDLRRNDGISVGTQDRRPRVEKLQGHLNEEGFGLDPDGKFGRQTNDAVNAVQDSAGLPQTQVVDELTAAAIATKGSQIVGLVHGDGLDLSTVGRRRRVSRLQQLLTEHGAPTKVDGMFGPHTQGALNAFQESVLLAPSEVVDAVTADILEGRSAPPEPICDEDIPILA